MKLKENSPEVPFLRRGYILIALLMCIIGGALALYATNLTIMLARHSAGGTSICDFNEWISCDAVLSTKFATMFGIPVAWLGFLFYLWSVIILIAALFRKDVEKVKGSAAVVLV
ncbi:MAG: vitamin K epoxide reductase family protein, partial [Ignavibacteriaceae bacterium]